MENQIVIESPDGTFRAYISQPAKLPAPAVVVLQELFGVNADIRATCDELAAQGFIANRAGPILAARARSRSQRKI
jgi:carboxymethylenebutenolidase